MNNIIIERKHYIIAGIILAIAFTLQPFALLFVQNYIAPQVANVIMGDSINNGQNNTDGVGSIINTENLKLQGNPDAKIYLVEFSDYECPFCARFHSTPKEIVEASGGKIAWAWKYFPLTQIHQNAYPAAIAAECVNKLGGSDKFWSYTDTLTNNYENLSENLYKAESAKLGINQAQFAACIKDSATKAAVDAEMKEGTDLGISGTPNTYIVKNEDGKLTVLESISGALPKATVEKMLQKYSE